jgi:hypothetical protein
MYIDRLLQVSDAQAVTATAVSTDVIDFGQVNPNVGMDGHSSMVITTDETALSAGATTVTFALQDSADNSAFADVAVTTAIGKAVLVAGYQHVIPMPTRLRRYVRVNYVVATGPLTAGRFSAQVVTGFQQNQAYPDSPRIV